MKTLLLFFSLLYPLYLFAQTSVRPWMGIQIEPAQEGVLIKAAIPDTPAFRAGLTAGDIILSIDNSKVSSPKELIAIVGNKGVGHEVKVKYLSQKKNKETTLKLEAMPGITELAEKRLLNKKAPDFKAKIYSGSKDKEFNLKKNNKVTILEFWATWCGACLQAHPIVSEFAKTNPNINMLAISNEVPLKLKKYLALAKEKKVINDSVLFMQGESDKIQEAYFVSAYPMFIVLDKKNIIKHITVGTGQNLLEVFKLASKLAQ